MTFEEAISAAPKTKPLGYDNPSLAQEYRQTLDMKPRGYDYPMLFWLKDLIERNAKVIDLGGNVGIHFYTYRNYLRFSPDIEWTVIDVPAIVRIGEKLAQEKGFQELTFTTDLKKTNGAHIFLASGSIQYFLSISSFLDCLSALPVKPRHLLLNRLPLYDGEQFVTLQNGGQVFYPQHVFNKYEFIESLRRLDYTLVDIWEDRIDSCRVPFNHSKCLPYYYGTYFTLKD